MGRTAIYLLSSAVVALTGLTITLASNPRPVGLSIGTSLIAAGVGSFAFAIMRFYDDSSSDSVNAVLNSGLERLHESMNHQVKATDTLRRTAFRTGHIDSRAYGIYPAEAITQELSRNNAKVEVDSFGLTLGRLLRLDLPQLLEREDCKVRLLVQHPQSPMFDLILSQEQRDREQCMRDIISVTKYVLERTDPASATAQSPAQRKNSVDIRWYRGYPTVTSIRIDDMILVRPRVPKEPLQMNAFYERYSREDGRAFQAYYDLYDQLWHEATEPTTSDLSDAETLLSGTDGAAGKS